MAVWSIPVLLWAALYSFGLLNEGRPSARLAEWVRLWLFMPLGVAWLQHDATIAPGYGPWLVWLVYAAASSAWLTLVVSDKIVLKQQVIKDT